MFTRHDSLSALLRHRAEADGEKTAYHFMEKGEAITDSLSYSDLYHQSRTLSARLAGRLQPRDRALLLYPPGLDFIVAFFACLAVGVIAVPAFPPQGMRFAENMVRLKAIIDNAGISLILGTARSLRFFDEPDKLAVRLDDIPHIVTDHTLDSLDDVTLEYEPHLRGVAMLQYTSGSTAAPRGVIITHENLLSNLAYIHSVGDYRQNCCSVSWLPAQHDLGLIEGILSPLYGRYTAHLMPPIAFIRKPFRWLDAISKLGARTSGAPNFAYDLCVEKISAEQRASLDLSLWAIAYNGAEPIRKSTLEKFSTVFGPSGFQTDAFLLAYGLAESTLLVSASYGSTKINTRNVAPFIDSASSVVRTPDEGEATVTLLSHGSPGKNSTVRIVDPQSHVALGEEMVGEIWVQGPCVGNGYWNALEISTSIFGATISPRGESTYLRTGDLGFFSGGELYIAGRIKDLIIIRGRKLYPQDIELMVERIDDLIRKTCVAAFSVEYDDSEQLFVVAELNRRLGSESDLYTMSALVDAIRHEIAQRYEAQVSGVALLPRGSIPKTTSGKIQRAQCRSDLLSDNIRTLFQWRAVENAEASLNEY